MVESILKLQDQVAELSQKLKTPLLLIVRLIWGYGFFQAGSGKFANMERTIGFFQSINIPLPELNAYFVAGLETVGGLMLIVGVFTRLISIPLIATMIVAYLTAHMDAVVTMFSDFQKFQEQGPFAYLVALLILLIAGSGCWSVDGFIGCKRNKN